MLQQCRAFNWALILMSSFVCDGSTRAFPIYIIYIYQIYQAFPIYYIYNISGFSNVYILGLLIMKCFCLSFSNILGPGLVKWDHIHGTLTSDYEGFSNISGPGLLIMKAFPIYWDLDF